MQELVRYARALLLLQLKHLEVSAQAGKGPAIKPEVLLADAGFGPREIADLLGKNYAAVAKAVSRARAGRARDAAQNDDDAGTNHAE
jgi:hypothetical protein